MLNKITIFEKEKDRLFAACFEPEEKDELDIALDFWRDFERLRSFFIHYREDLLRFEPTLKVKDAVKQVLTEAETIYDLLIMFSERDNLHTLFKPLDNRENEKAAYEFQKLKAKGAVRKGMLRLYAVKFRTWYVITGSAIKLTDQMSGRPHLKRELKKLEHVKRFLQDDSPEISFVYLDCE